MKDRGSDDESLKRGVARWLQREGYPLEMRSAATIQTSGFVVEAGEYYEDPNTGKYREIDIVATRYTGSCGGVLEVLIRLVIECKSSRHRPWVAFSSGPFERCHLNLLKQGPGPAYYLGTNLSRIAALPSFGVFNGWECTAYAIKTGARLKHTNEDDTSEKGQGKDYAFEAISEVVSALRDWAEIAPLRGLLGGSDRVVIPVVIPVIITDADLVSARLEGSELRLDRQEVVRLRWKGDGSIGGTAIDVVTESALEKYLASVVAEAENVLAACMADPTLVQAPSTSIFSRVVANN